MRANAAPRRSSSTTTACAAWISASCASSTPTAPGSTPYDGRVVSNFILQALAGVDLTLYGQGEQTRSFCYVADTVDALVRMMNNDENFHGPVNVGNPQEITIRQLAETVLKLIGSTSGLTHRPLPADDPTQRRPEITLAGEKLGWEPTTDLARGLAKTIDYFRNLDLNNYNPPTKNTIR